MAQRFGVIAAALMAIVALAACGESRAEYPNWPTVAAEMPDGTEGLANWVSAPVQGETARAGIAPNHIAFQGALSWFAQSDHRDPKKAALQVLKAEGLKGAKVLAIKRADREIVAMLDAEPKAQVHAVVLEGKRDGKASRAIALVWYGAFGHQEGVPANSGVMAFVAPEPAYEALGGLAVPGVRWLGGTTTPDEDMREEGTKSPKASVDKLIYAYEAWGQVYAAMQLQAMSVQMNTLLGMMSYNNALAQCAGQEYCTVQMDGTGGYTAEFD